MAEIEGVDCQCRMRNGLAQEVQQMQENGTWDILGEVAQRTILLNLESSACHMLADSSTGEALLCLGCHVNHKQFNEVPKRLPRRSMTKESA